MDGWMDFWGGAGDEGSVVRGRRGVEWNVNGGNGMEWREYWIGTWYVILHYIG